MTIPPEVRNERVLVVAPTGRDAVLAQRALADAGLQADLCPDLHRAASEIAAGAGALLVAEEALTPAAAADLEEALRGQPTWCTDAARASCCGCRSRRERRRKDKERPGPRTPDPGPRHGTHPPV